MTANGGPGSAPGGRVPVLYLAPWVDYGGSDKGTIDWFRWLDRSRFAPSLVTTQPSANRRLAEVTPYAEEVWPLPDLIDGKDMPAFVFDFIATRGVEVLHVMNSRLAFELLPDLASLPRPPKVVVQLHVEEADRSGYVRLVARRYGNLVDRFSVTSHHLAAAVRAYDVPAAKLRVIHTGIDAEREFNPARVVPEASLRGDDAVHVLYPHRLVAQKDPLLMVDVAARAVGECPRLRVHVLGEGELEPAVRARIEALGLGDGVRLHPPGPIAPWFAASDLALMTSTFEGVPYVVFEAMAMGVPVVAPALPGNRELLGESGGVLVEPRADAGAYARALVELAEDPVRRAEIARQARERALGELSVREMARAHERLYEELIEPVPAPAPDGAPAPAAPDPPRFRRPRAGHPLVSVIVPCFDDGRYLPDCLRSIAEQTWPAVEVIVVDDHSGDPDTRAILEGLEAGDAVEVVRMEHNGGPSRARNAGLERARGRYVLPVDADNMLLADAIERLVRQLAGEGERVGFIYPNLQYFGSRRDYFEAPPYDRYALLEGNYCDTCSLFDADVFAGGVRFAEDIRLGHEDWDLALALAERGVEGRPAAGPTVLYRKSGFTRSDLVEYGAQPFVDVALERHPGLFGGAGRFGYHSGPAVSAKARWSPGLSIVPLAAMAAGGEAPGRLRARLWAQTCRDVEVLARTDAHVRDLPQGPALRRIPAALAGSPAAALGDGLRAARAPFVLVTAGTGSDLLADPAFAEKVLRAALARDRLAAIAFCDAGPEGRHPLRRLEPGEAPGAPAHAVLLTRDARLKPLAAELLVDAGAPVDSLVKAIAGDVAIEWRHFPAPRAPGAALLPAGQREPVRPRQRGDVPARLQRLPGIPAVPAQQVRRWTEAGAWMPPGTLALVRHRRIGGEERVVTNVDVPPPGFEIEFHLGCVHRDQPPGTAELRVGGPEGFLALPDEDEGAPRRGAPRHPDCLGFLEQAAFPLLDALEVAFHPQSDRWILICGAADPLMPVIERRRTLGFLEAFPNQPRLGPAPMRGHGLRALVRSVDAAARRHRYACDGVPPGRLSLELGALHREPQPGSVGVWLHDDRVATEAVTTPAASAGLAARARWARAPLGWSGGDVPLAPRARAAVRRTLEGMRRAQPAPPAPEGAPAGYLWSEGGPARRPLHLAVHPVTGDQLLTPWPQEALDMGYGEPVLLGWLSTMLSLTGSLAATGADVPWASRFGRRARRR